MDSSQSANAKKIALYDPRILIGSIILQLLLGLFLGHLFEMRFYMATGYLVGTGQNPYVPQDLSAVFGNPYFRGITSFGYPPPWALVLGLIYKSVYAVIPSMLLYNLAIKIPIIAANIALAYGVTFTVKKMGGTIEAARHAWIFMLLNPFILYASAAWGQIDSIVALLSLLAIVCLHCKKEKCSALILALALSIKPIALPLVAVAAVYVWKRSKLRALRYFTLVLATTAFLCIVPFLVFHWDSGIIVKNWNAHFVVAGCMSYLSFLELIVPSFVLPGAWQWLGFLWIPALAISLYAMKNGISNFEELLKKSIAAILVFFLTRTWMSEPNLILLVPFVLILASLNNLDRFTLTALWVLPLIFGIFNGSASLLLFPTMPDIMDKLGKIGETYRILRLGIRTAVVIPWLILGWRTVFICNRTKQALEVPAC